MPEAEGANFWPGRRRRVTIAMKPAHPRRLRRTLLILGVCWLALSTAWVARRWWAVRSVNQAMIFSSFDVWDLPFNKQSPWLKFFPTARVTGIYSATIRDNGQRLGWALRTCGPVNQIAVNGGWPEIQAFLRALGPEKELRTLAIDDARTTYESFWPILRQFPNLEYLHLTGMSGHWKDFPRMEALQSIEVHGFPGDELQFSDEDLATLLQRCPALTELRLSQGSVTREGLLNIAQWRPARLVKISILWSTLDQQDEKEFMDQMARRCPGLQLTLE
jgi:hypothetical protein